MEKHLKTKGSIQLPEALNRLLLTISSIVIVLFTPFMINDFIQGRLFSAIISTVIVSCFAINTWGVYKNRRYYPKLIFFGLVPAIIVFLVYSIHKQGIMGIVWCYPAVISFYFMLPEYKARLANTVLLVIIAPIIWNHFNLALIARIAISLLIVSTLSAIFVNMISEQQKKIKESAATDHLTGVLNRKRLQETLEQAIQQNDRTHMPMSILTFDLDYFKKINDEFGHATGDRVLQDVAKLIKNRSRRVDKVFRLGGEEFLLFLYNTGIEAGKNLSEELRTEISLLQTIPNHNITVSIGVASLEQGENWLDWMKRSDQNLYTAKSSGRNKVVAS